MALVDLGGDDQVDRPVLVLEQHEHDPVRRARTLAGHHQPSDPNPRAVAQRLAAPGWSRHPRAAARAAAPSDGRCDRQPGGAVVGEHRLPPDVSAASSGGAGRSSGSASWAPPGTSLPGVATPSCHSAIRRAEPGVTPEPGASCTQRVARPRPRQQLQRRGAGAGARGEIGQARGTRPPASARRRPAPGPPARARPGRNPGRCARVPSPDRSRTRLALVDVRAAAPRSLAAAPREPARRADRSPSAARSAASTGTRGRSGPAARSTGRRAGRRRPRVPWGSRSPRSPRTIANTRSAVSSSTPCLSRAPATNRLW